MKHDVKTTAELVAWFVASLLFGAWMIPRTGFERLPTDISPWILAGMAVGAVIVGAVMWWGITKFAKRAVVPAFIVGTGLALSDVMMKTKLPYAVSIFGVMIVGYAITVAMMRRSWTWVRRLYWFSNIVICVTVAGVGAIFGSVLPFWIGMTMFVVLAIYDAIAVWKTGHMQSMAMAFVKERAIPGIAVPKEEEEEWALLGGGDIFVVVMVMALFWKAYPSLVGAAAAGMSFAIVYLFFISEKKKFYPALPFILGGMVLAVGLAAAYQVAIYGVLV